MIKMTKEQFKQLLLTIMAGSWVRSSVMENRGEDYKKAEKWEDYFVEMAYRLGYDDLVELFKGKMLPNNDICLESEQEIEEYNDDNFWFELENRLGKRDFFEKLSKEEEEEIEKKQWLPEKVHKFYKKYQKEFEKYGIERLRIVKKKL